MLKIATSQKNKSKKTTHLFELNSRKTELKLSGTAAQIRINDHMIFPLAPPTGQTFFCLDCGCSDLCNLKGALTGNQSTDIKSFSL